MGLDSASDRLLVGLYLNLCESGTSGLASTDPVEPQDCSHVFNFYY